MESSSIWDLMSHGGGAMSILLMCAVASISSVRRVITLEAAEVFK